MNTAILQKFRILSLFFTARYLSVDRRQNLVWQNFRWWRSERNQSAAVESKLDAETQNWPRRFSSAQYSNCRLSTQRYISLTSRLFQIWDLCRNLTLKICAAKWLFRISPLRLRVSIYINVQGWSNRDYQTLYKRSCPSRKTFWNRE